MDAQLARESARELDKTVTALALGLQFLEGIDLAMAAFRLDERRSYSPLRTFFEHGLVQAERVRALLDSNGSPEPEPESSPTP